MQYTVKQIAKLSGVSVRTMHWYDKIDLLKPSHINQTNGYRCYREEQLLLLQQILFFKKLGVKLSDIRKILASNDFDKIRALHVHKVTLEEDVCNTKILINTIEKTISHLRGKKTMTSKELYNGFDAPKQKEYEQYFVKYNHSLAEALIHENVKAPVSDETKKFVAQEGNEIYKALAECIDKKLGSESDEAQTLMSQHYKLMGEVSNASKEVYLAYAELYSTHPEFKKLFEQYHPGLKEFIVQAMKAYVGRNLA